MFKGFSGGCTKHAESDLLRLCVALAGQSNVKSAGQEGFWSGGKDTMYCVRNFALCFENIDVETGSFFKN